MAPFICCVFNDEGLPVANATVTIRPPNRSTLRATTNSQGFAGIWTSHCSSSEPRFVRAFEFPEFLLTVHLVAPYNTCWSMIHADVRLVEMPHCCLIVRLGVGGSYQIQYITLPEPSVLHYRPDEITTSSSATSPPPNSSPALDFDIGAEADSDSDADADADPDPDSDGAGESLGAKF
ncbi:hypothetical protein LA080_011826 [Diaporthe eres]|nr:hypothetical protein LA080_011826 [Diaporthe eres]